MNYLIDTCVLSETVKKTPNHVIVNWLNQQHPERLFISNITLAELRKGIYKIQHSQPERYEKLLNWLNNIELKFHLRILPINDKVLTYWSKISAPPVMITIANRTETSARIKYAFEHQQILIQELCEAKKLLQIEGIIRKYYPDFIIRLTNGEHLILEVKGQEDELSKTKHEFLSAWVTAVNEHGGFGQWKWDVSYHPGDLKMKLATTLPHPCTPQHSIQAQ